MNLTIENAPEGEKKEEKNIEKNFKNNFFKKKKILKKFYLGLILDVEIFILTSN